MKLSKEDILEARNKTGLNQEQFADLLMISESYLAKLETSEGNQDRDPSPKKSPEVCRLAFAQFVDAIK